MATLDIKYSFPTWKVKQVFYSTLDVADTIQESNNKIKNIFIYYIFRR